MWRRTLGAILMAAILTVGLAYADDDLLGKKGGRGGGGSGGSAGGGHGAPPPERGPKRGGDSGNSNSNSGGSRRSDDSGPAIIWGGSGGSRNTVDSGRTDRRGGDRGSVDVGPGRRGSDSILGKSAKGQSRSGSVSYGTRSNIEATIQNRDLVRGFERPTPRMGNRIGQQVGRENRIEANQRYRHGYYPYRRDWRDDYFCYPYYRFNWDTRHCVLSPWYAYPHMPGYLLSVRVDTGNWSFMLNVPDRYVWRRPSRSRGWGWGNSYDSGATLDYAIDDIVRAFESGRMSYLDNLLPRHQRVYVEMRDGWRYSMDSDDFYDQIRDLVEGTETASYRIQNVRVGRTDVMIEAQHDYIDSWGDRRRAYHRIGLREYRGDYAIVYFACDDNRW